uniref:Membrane progestin receptor delta isoform X2 n=1 Tax=Geotrypetes seraphini TaxID=260995 RepID=A0A6P8PGK9_GEOSA|nr:membrane progestin receptor delta isoform X2 [Geotrypetes seraphini]
MLTVKLPQLLNIHQVPQVFRTDGIISGYRHPKSSALDCILSSFRMTNETLNIWTHFLPTWYFLWRFLVLSTSLDFCTDPYNWPLLLYLLVICLYPFTSSCAHTFSTMSPHACHFCYFLDYGALSLYSLGCAFTYSAYIMPDRWINSPLHLHFTQLATLNSFICTALSCYSRSVDSWNWKPQSSAKSFARQPLSTPSYLTTFPSYIGCCSVGATGAPGTLPSLCTSITSSSPFSPASSSPPIYLNAWRLDVSIMWVTATSSSMSAPCWARISSWKPFWWT